MDTVQVTPSPTAADDSSAQSVSDPAATDTWNSRIGTFRSGATGISGADLAVLLSIFFLPCAFLPVFQLSWWTPRIMVLIAVIPVGTIALARLVRAGDVAARWAVGAVATCFVGAVMAESFLASLKGYVGQDSSVLSFVGCFSLWAIARFMTADGKRLVVPVLLAAFGANLLIATLQVVAQLETGSLALSFGRASGFTPNPVYLGALMAGGAGLCLHRLATVSHRRRVWAVGSFAFSAGVAFSGSRVALLAVVVLAFYCLARCKRVWALAGAVAAAAGTLAGSLVVRTFGSGRDSVSRLGESTGSGERFPTWRVALDAFIEQPVFGWGIGRFRYATQGRLGAEDIAPLDGGSFFDAHNVVVGLAVAVGVPGLICFAGFAWSTVRRVNPGVGAAAAAIVVTWTLQPLSLTTTPLVFALLGVWNESSTSSLTGQTPWDRRILRTAVGVGLSLAATLGAVDFSFNSAVEANDTERLLALEPLYLNDPVVSNIVAQSLFNEVVDEASTEELFDALQRSIDADPTRERWWYERARYEGYFGDPDAALASAQQALALEPFERRSWNIVRIAAQELGDTELEREAVAVLCQLDTEDSCNDNDATAGREP